MIVIDFIILSVLEILARKNLINTLILPAPSKILFQSNFYEIIMTFIETLKIVGIVFLISILINMLVVILIYWLDFKYIEHLLYRLNIIPKIMIVLIGIALLGVGYRTIIIISIISSMPNFIITVLGYLKNENNKILIEASKDCGVDGLMLIVKVLLPANLKGIIISLKILFSNVINSIIIGEYLIGNRGIGSVLQYNLFMYDMKNVWMIALIIIVFSLIVSKIFDILLNSKKIWFNL